LFVFPRRPRRIKAFGLTFSDHLQLENPVTGEYGLFTAIFTGLLCRRFVGPLLICGFRFAELHAIFIHRKS